MERRPTRRELVRRMVLGGAAALAAPSLGPLLTACGATPPGAGRRGGSVSYAIAIEPQTLDPVTHTLAVESTVMGLLFPGLLRTNRAGAFEPELARRIPSIEDGGMTYRFTLRSGLLWQDGAPLTSGDLLFTYQTYVDPRTKAAYLAGWEKIQQVETPDAATVVFRMQEPFAPFLSTVGSAAVLPRHVLEGVQDLRHDRFSRSPVGCGPFKMRSWTSGSEIVLEANDRYWGGRPALDRFVFKVVPSAATQVEQLEAGEVDIVSVQPEQWNQVKALAPGVKAVAYDDTKYVLVQLDEYEALRDVRVRQALDLATPKDDIVSGVLHGLAVGAVADVPPGSPYFDRAVSARRYDPQRARSLLGAAGFTLQNGLMARDGKPLEVPIYTLSTAPTYVQIGQVLKDSWSKIGVRTDLTTMDAATLFGDRGPQWNGRDAALIFGWSQGVDPGNYVNWSSKQIPDNEDDPGENYERYSNPLVDELVVQGLRTTDTDQRKLVYAQLQRILANDVPVIFLYWPKSLFAYTAQLQGFAPNAFSGPWEGVTGWTKR